MFQCQETTPTKSFACEISVRGSFSQFNFRINCSVLEKHKIFTSRKFPAIRYHYINYKIMESVYAVWLAFWRFSRCYCSAHACMAIIVFVHYVNIDHLAISNIVPVDWASFCECLGGCNPWNPPLDPPLLSLYRELSIASCVRELESMVPIYSCLDAIGHQIWVRVAQTCQPSI